MSNELNLLLDTGLTLTGKVYNVAGTQQGTNVSMTEVATSQYSGTFDVSTLADGNFPVHFYNGAVLVGTGELKIKDGAEIIPSTQTSVDTIDTNVDAILVGIATTIPAQITALNNLSAAQVATELATYDAPTKAEMDAAFTEIKGPTFTSTDTLEAIRDRGDSAWITATGFATPANITDAQTALTTEINANETKIDALETKAQADARQALLIAEHDDTQATLAGLNDISTADVATELATYDAPTKAELDSAVAPLATQASVDTVDGIVDAILLDTGTTIPAQITGLNDVSTADIDTALATYDAPTKAELDTAQAAIIAQVDANEAKIDTAITQATLARKHLTNRDKIDTTANTLTRYDDDGTTALVVFDLKDGDGDASSTQIYEKTPQ